jgi:hypothetical protein
MGRADHVAWSTYLQVVVGSYKTSVHQSPVTAMTYSSPILGRISSRYANPKDIRKRNQSNNQCSTSGFRQEPKETQTCHDRQPAPYHSTGTVRALCPCEFDPAGGGGGGTRDKYGRVVGGQDETRSPARNFREAMWLGRGFRAVYVEQAAESEKRGDANKRRLRKRKGWKHIGGF